MWDPRDIVAEAFFWLLVENRIYFLIEHENWLLHTQNK